METLNIIQHNVIKWTRQRRNELWNIYNTLSPDIILLNATGIKNEERIKFFGFNTHHRNLGDEDHAGIGILIRKGIKYKLIENANLDLMAIEIETTQGPIVIATLYIPHRRPLFPMQEILDLLRLNKPVYIIGDINARHRSLGSNSTNDLGRTLNILINRNLITHLGPDFVTWIHPTRTGTPDLVLGNKKIHHNIAITQGPITSSDHIPVIVKIASKPIIKEQKPRFNLEKANWESFQYQLREKAELINLNQPSINADFIDEKAEQWQNLILETMEECIPKRKHTILPHPRESGKQKEIQYYYNRLKSIGEREGWTMVQRNLFKALQNQLTEECIKQYHDNWNKLLTDVEMDKKDPKQFWGKIRKMMGGKEDTIPYLVDNTGNKYFKSEEKEELYREIWEQVFQITPEENNAFCNTTEAEVETYLQANGYRTQPYHRASLNRLNALNALTKPIETYQIIVIIKQFKNRAPGESQVGKLILDKLPIEMIRKLKDILNLTLSIGYFPKLYKIAILRFIQKEGKDGTRPINYRPISLLEVVGKILERIINDRLVKYLEENNLFNNNQYGFRKGRGTQVALASLYEQIALTQKEKYRCNVVCSDVSKAFDKVWHGGLIYKIFRLNLPDIFEKILCSFLKDRIAKIKIDDYIGTAIPLRSGVPQGSILSPTLYIYYIADMPEPGPGSYVIGFADDNTQIITYPGTSKRMLTRRTVNEIEKVNNFERKWKIQTNKDKFKLVSISSTKPLEVRVDNQIIPYSKTATILGLTISSRGISPHMGQRIKKAQGQIQRLKRFRKISPDIKLHLYKTLVRPIMEYPAIPICITAKSNIKKLQVVQTKALRAAINDRRLIHGRSNEDVHQLTSFEAMNTRLHELASRTWQKLENLDPDLILKADQIADRITYEHYWWPTVTGYMRANTQGVMPIYTW